MQPSRSSVWFIALALTAIMLFAGCAAPAAPAVPAAAEEATAAPAGEATAAPAEEAAPAAEMQPMQIGLVTDVGRINDRSFNQSAWEGVQAAAAEMGLAEEDVKYIETQDAKDYADNMQQFIDAGFSVIVTVGAALGDATTTAAKENPDVHFIGVDQQQQEELPNVTGLVFSEDKAGYLAGVLAASLTKSGTIAAVLGTDLVPPVVAFKEGYEAGAMATNPDIKVISTYPSRRAVAGFHRPRMGRGDGQAGD